MGFKFNVHRRPNSFSVRMRSYDDADKIKHGKSDAKFVEINLPRNEWARYGFDVDWTIEQVTGHCIALNAVTGLMQQEERKARVNNVVESQRRDAFESAYLPEHIVTAFENKLEGSSFVDEEFRDTRAYYHWRKAMGVIAELSFPPEQWSESSGLIIKKMKGFAPSTITRTLHYMNSYGIFYSKRMNKFFEPIPKLSGKAADVMSKEYSKKTGGKSKARRGVTPTDMNRLINSSELTQSQKDWCVVCLGFALRPIEMSYIGDSDKFALKKNSVVIYQSKLIGKIEELRLKEVNITYPFQKAAWALVKASKELTTPSTYYIQKILGEGYGLYSFRKGYTEIMHNLGATIERTAFDMGHTTTNITMRVYSKQPTLKGE